MKATNHFTRTILTYLEQRAQTDSLFADTFAKENKNIDDCVTFILDQVQKSGCNGFADDEIYSMAVHYYNEDDIEVGKPMQGNIVVNHVVQLTEEEKEQARKDAIQKAMSESYNKLTIKKKSSSKQTEATTQLTLF